MKEVEVGYIVKGYCEAYKRDFTIWVERITDKTFINTSFNGKQLEGIILHEKDFRQDRRFGWKAFIIVNKYHDVEILKTGVSKEQVLNKAKIADTSKIKEIIRYYGMTKTYLVVYYGNLPAEVKEDEIPEKLLQKFKKSQKVG